MQRYLAGELKPDQLESWRADDGVFYLVSEVDAAVEEKERTIQEGCQIIAEGLSVVENLEGQIATLKEALDTIESMATDTTHDIQGIAQAAIKGGKP